MEKDCNLLVALAVKERLEATGRAVVYMTRSDDTYVSLKARTDMLPDCGAQLFCSIHCNSGAPDAFGAEVLVPYGAAYHVEAAQRGQEIGRTVAQELGKIGLRRTVQKIDRAFLLSRRLGCRLLRRALPKHFAEYTVASDRNLFYLQCVGP